MLRTRTRFVSGTYPRVEALRNLIRRVGNGGTVPEKRAADAESG